jgi:hypothetical protein
LRQVDRCFVCDESFGQTHADDGPAWLTIDIVGHIVVPMALFCETNFQWPLLFSMTVWPLTAFALTMTILPRAMRGHRPRHELKRSDRRPELFVDARDKLRLRSLVVILQRDKQAFQPS